MLIRVDTLKVCTGRANTPAQPDESCVAEYNYQLPRLSLANLGTVERTERVGDASAFSQV